MMKKNTALFIVVSIMALLSIASAQTPGYMGKRFAIGYGFHFSPAVFGSNAEGSSILGKENGNASTGEPAFNALHEGFVEYALSKRFLIGASAKFYKTTYDNHKELYVTVVRPNQYGYNETVSYSGNPTGFYHIKGQNYSLYGKLFNRSYIAPWGRYMMFGININRYTCSYDPSEMKLKYSYSSYGDTYAPVTDFGPREQTFMRYDLLFGFGRTRILVNRVTLDYGFNVNAFALLNTLFDAVSDNDDFFSSTRPTNTGYIENTAPWRLRGVNRFNVFLRVGVLLF